MGNNRLVHDYGCNPRKKHDKDSTGSILNSMFLNRRNLYFLLITACLTGYVWLYFNIGRQPEINSADVCMIKHATGIPCPSCGSTRSIISLVQGNFIQSILINPMGLIILLIMLLAPIWILFDLVIRKDTLFKAYNQIESILKKREIAIPLIVLVIINWIWNITKGL
jgi:hypothetical protein